MGWGEVKKINSDLSVPLNHLIWLNDYKTYGKDSYVFQNKDMLHELYRSPISINDNSVMEEVVTYAVEHQIIGSVLKNLYGVDVTLGWDNIHELNDIFSDGAIQTEVFSKYGLLKALIKKFVQNETAMNIMCDSQACLSMLYDNYLYMTDIFASSPYLLSASQASSLYEVTVSTETIYSTHTSARRTHYNNKCFILGMTQNVNRADYYESCVNTLSDIRSTTNNISYATDGITWRINEFADSAKCHPCVYTSGEMSTGSASYMAILKIE